MSTQTIADFETLSHIEEIARLTLVAIGDDETWNRKTISWSKR